MIDIETIKTQLLSEVLKSQNPSEVLKSPKIKELYSEIPKIDNSKRAEYGKQVNELKLALDQAILKRNDELQNSSVTAIDVSASMDFNAPIPGLLSSEYGTIHPLSTELYKVIDIFTRMGFDAIESRQIDDDFHMFEALNFPEGHPARDGYDTFRTEEGFIPPAHTSTMQNRILASGKERLENGDEIAAISYGRVFRNEDVDATHEHTFYQYEGVFVSKTATLGDMLGVLRSFFETYYGQDLKIKTQPGYFPFVEPGLEFFIEKPESLGGKSGEWLEMMGCGMIHPNVLKAAGIDPSVYRGFAWGGGVDRLVMLKYGIEDLRHFEAGRLEFLRKFKS
jgi:phenylalanyl-tRNA synthetase alpha chain